MNEDTVRIQRDELRRLLDTMTPVAQQMVTQRMPVVREPSPARTAALIPPMRITRPMPVLRAKTEPGLTNKPAIVVAAVPDWEVPPRIEMAETPEAFEVRSAPSKDSGHSIEVSAGLCLA